MVAIFRTTITEDLLPRNIGVMSSDLQPPPKV
jgi:hypothetical protein